MSINVNKFKLIKNDTVKILSGKDKGRTGKIIRILRKANRIVVEGVNIIKKHVKPNPNKGIQGGIVEREAAIHYSNVALYNEESGKTDKVSYTRDENNRKVRVYHSDSSKQISWFG